MLYFGILNSQLGGGQTLGKRILRIKVVGRDDQTIRIDRSCLRYIVFNLPWALQMVPVNQPPILLILLFAALYYGVMTSIIYLILFNRKTRQSLHDLVANTLVVDKGETREGQNNVGKIWNGHILVTVALFIATATGALLLAKSPLPETLPGNLATTIAALNEEPGVESITLKRLFMKSLLSTKDTNQTHTNLLTIEVILKSNMINDVDLARRLASILVENSPEVRNEDNIAVTMKYGFSFGILNSWKVHKHVFPMDDIKAHQPDPV